MAKPALIAKITTLDGKRDEAIAVFRKMIDHVTEAEPGTEVYALHTDDKDANVVWFYELYESDAALSVHGATDASKAIAKGLAGLLAGRPEIIKLTSVTGKGLAL